MNRTKTLLLLLAAVSMAPAARAQIAAGVALTGQNLTQYYTPGQSKWIYGPTISLQDEHGHVLKLGGDLRASFLRRDGVGVNSFAIGPRASVKLPAVPIRPYAEVLIGIIGVRSTNTGPFTTHVEYQYVFGVDQTVLPHVDWRVLEYSHGGVVNSSEDKRDQLSTGLIFRFF